MATQTEKPSPSDTITQYYLSLVDYLSNHLTAAIESINTDIAPLFNFDQINNINTNNTNTNSINNANTNNNNSLIFKNNKHYTHIFGFERNFESRLYANSKRSWMEKNWTISFKISVIYCLCIVLGTAYMRNRQRFELRFFLIIWNMMLAIFSIIGTIRVLPEFLDAWDSHGLNYTICNNDYAYGITGFWAYMFIMSKLPELVDTVFIVFRKQRLIFLHWYHHATVLIYCWFSYKEFTSTGRWFMCMNYCVHSLMYSYYAFKAMRIQVPRSISKLITCAQISQMIAGIYVNYIAYDTIVNKNESCQISIENIKYSFLMYASYFALFFHFFLKSYVFKKATTSASTSSSSRGTLTPGTSSAEPTPNSTPNSKIKTN
jgi:elongation of very long chain fatty acids protein 6